MINVKKFLDIGHFNKFPNPKIAGFLYSASNLEINTAAQTLNSAAMEIGFVIIEESFS